jgi:hypothetical protein
MVMHLLSLSSGNWIASASLGKYKGYVVENGFGPSPRSVPLRGDRLEPISTHVTISDEDKVITKLVSGKHSRSIRDLAARIKIVAPGIPAEAYYTRFNGQINDYEMVGHDQYRFELGPKLFELEGLLKVPIVTKAIWPNAHDNAVGKVASIIYGVHSSASLGSRGMIPCPYVDTVNYKYLVSHQYIEDVTNVYVDHVVQASGWTEENVLVDGHRYTLINFTTNQGDATITVDAKGGAFAGNAVADDEITNPAQQLMYILSNYVFNEWDGTTANWHDSSADDAPIDWALFASAEQLFNSRGVKGAISISEPMTGLQLLNMWATEYFPVFWTANAEVGVRTDDWYASYADWTATKPIIKESEHFLNELSYKFSNEMLADELNVGFLYSDSDNEALERIRVKDTLRGWNIKEEIDLQWSESTV